MRRINGFVKLPGREWGARQVAYGLDWLAVSASGTDDPVLALRRMAHAM